MLRPRIVAPMLLVAPTPDLVVDAARLVLGPSSPNIRRALGVRNIHSWSDSPPTPRGSSRVWSGPAPYPSTEIEKLWTRSLGMVTLLGQLRTRGASPGTSEPTGGFDIILKSSATPGGRPGS